MSRTLVALLALVSAGGSRAMPQGKPPLKLILDHTIDAGSKVSFGSIAGLDIGLDGSVVAVDDANGVIYRFTPAGVLRDSLSHRGQGPGEFLASAGIALGPAGEIALADIKTRRLTFWAPDGRLLRSASISSGVPVSLLWRGADPVLGVLVFSDSITAGFYPVRFGIGESAGPWIGRFTEVPMNQRATAVSCGGCRASLSAEGKLVVAAPDTFYRVSELDAGGHVLRRWSRIDAGAGRRTDEETAALHARILAGPGGGRPNPEGAPKAPIQGEVRFRNRFQGIGIDARGRLLALVSNAGSTDPVLDVFDAGGKFLGSVLPPKHLQSLVLRGNSAVALGESAEGEPVIYVFRIEEVP